MPKSEIKPHEVGKDPRCSSGSMEASERKKILSLACVQTNKKEPEGSRYKLAIVRLEIIEKSWNILGMQWLSSIILLFGLHSSLACIHKSSANRKLYNSDSSVFDFIVVLHLFN